MPIRKIKFPFLLESIVNQIRKIIM